MAQGLGPASVIVASYNQRDRLALALAAFARQSIADFELIVADDGSQEDYASLLRTWAPRFRFGIRHVWHEDRGFRKTRILNRAVSVARFDRLIFADSDCLPHRDFVRNHVRHLRRGTVITGRRVHIEKGALSGAEEVLQGGLKLGIVRLVWLWLRGRARVIEHGVVVPFLHEASRGGILGSNFSLYRSDLEAVNGFNEEYREWGTGEDGDIELRLRFQGVPVRVLRNQVVQYHVAHPQNPDRSQRNRAIYERTRASRTAKAAIGLAEIQAGDFLHTHYT